ncbi:hypothetical protein [Neobacillus muris]|uniref:hypothetical protein n=1 Tax=Neobacillus muris TaxID=2941334 RepID=UPI00204158C2|nr:hypothetical protein [Neobacillus muris]
MDHSSNLPYKQLLVPPFRKETGVPKEELPVFSAMNPIVPPFLPYRGVRKYPKYPSFQQQLDLLKKSDKKSRGM